MRTLMRMTVENDVSPPCIVDDDLREYRVPKLQKAQASSHRYKLVISEVHTYHHGQFDDQARHYSFVK